MLRRLWLRLRFRWRQSPPIAPSMGLDLTAISGWHLLQIAGAIFIIYLIFHFLEKHW